MNKSKGVNFDKIVYCHITGGKTYSFSEENPFKDDEDEDSDNPNPSQNKNREGGKEELGSVGYRYRVFDLGNYIRMVIRCEVNGVLQPTGDDASNSPQIVCIRALNEFDSRYCGGVDWRTKLDTQRRAVLAAEIKNNAFKLAGWTVCSILSGADQLKLGYVIVYLNVSLYYADTEYSAQPVLRIYALQQDAFDSDEDKENISEEVAVIEQQNAEPSKTEVNVLEHGQDNLKIQSRKVGAISQPITDENNKP
ncbi:hypothetical protein MN116_008151 [Schistosoma mekongi]|uniref:Uncharacterized protein n=1 Tax=Schistosoma mekongi TaxID=38744 RepID=A0AAE1Z767_SCHME|nr:hypothetical protein MN116_008151 [Schistosoma mekongi]